MVQARKRSIFNLVLFAALSIGAGAAVFHPSTAFADDDSADDAKACTTTDFKYPAVKAACKEGGRKAAKKLMKAAMDKAKAAGKDWKCKHCHENMKDYKLTAEAVNDLKPFI
jgi:hypothetical protein